MSSPTDTLAELVGINSVNPEWDGPGESDVADYVTAFLEQAQIEVTTHDVLPGRPNVIGRLPGQDSSRSLVLEAHMDTVSVAGMSIDPFAAKISEGRMWGRGTCDTKAGLAAMLHALAAIKRKNLRPPVDVLLLAVIDEEHLFRGVNHFVASMDDHPQPIAAIVAEPTELKVVRANKGVLRWQIITRGRAAHSSTPHLGASAISAMADVIRTFEENPAAGDHDLVGPPTCTIGTIHGGRQVNFVPDECCIKIDRRLIPGESAAEVHHYYGELLDQVRKRHPKVLIDNEAPYLADEAMETAENEEVVQVASETLQSMGLPGTPVGVPFGCDATKLSRAGVPSIVFGPGSIAQAHTADEYVEIAQVEKACEFYRQFIMQFGAA